MSSLLPSWNEGPARRAILGVHRGRSPAPDRSSFRRPSGSQRFDNDGTLWCEKPLYPQADFIFRRWAEMVKANPDTLRRTSRTRCSRRATGRGWRDSPTYFPESGQGRHRG